MMRRVGGLMRRNVSSTRFRDASVVLNRLSLTSGLQLCLDAGDAASYTSGKKWLDVSGNGADFHVGSSASTTGTEPTFNGTPGADSSYWGFDGTDYFTYDSSNETWMNNLHKDNAAFTLLMWARFPSVASLRLMGTGNTSGTDVGVTWGTTAGGLLNHAVLNGAGSARAFNGTATTTVTADEWQMLSWSHNEAAGAAGAIIGRNATTETASSTYTSPSSSAATYTMKIGANGQPSGRLPSGSRIGMFLAWSAALTAEQIGQIYTETRSRFGV